LLLKNKLQIDQIILLPAFEGFEAA